MCETSPYPQPNIPLHLESKDPQEFKVIFTPFRNTSTYSEAVLSLFVHISNHPSRHSKRFGILHITVMLMNGSPPSPIPPTKFKTTNWRGSSSWLTNTDLKILCPSKLIYEVLMIFEIKEINLSQHGHFYFVQNLYRKLPLTQYSNNDLAFVAYHLKGQGLFTFECQYRYFRINQYVAQQSSIQTIQTIQW